ncbi:MAG: peptidoglycan-binding protein [Actinomycetota bacterium]|nr:peptidoglycan-binding protein [Actinomycetota bacterium]MDA2994065.1 peptidoglycan-binding protein [Actinomycetota bacterium]
MNISLRTRLPRRLGYKIIAAGLVVTPLLASTGSVQAASPSIAALQGLTTGSSGESVKALQEALIARGIAVVGGADGHFGPKTLAALNEFQRSVGLEVTNSVDEATAIAVGTAISPLTGLAVGSTGESVKALQEALIGAGHTPKGGADGRFGPATEAALRAFQNGAGLPVTGVADEITVARLGAVTNAPVASSPAEESNSAPAEQAPVLAPEISEFIGVRYGAVSAAAKAVQQLLIDAGVSLRGGADGEFGRVSEAALKQFQKSAGLEASGVADEATLMALTAPSNNGEESAVAVSAEYSQLVGLRPGALGESVAALQRRLLDLGVTVRGGADGIFGPATSSSVKAFQTDRGLEATGIVDDETAAALSRNSASEAATEDDHDHVADSDSATTTQGFGVYGETSERVAALQRALMNVGITVRGGADGVFGSATSAAVMSFQRREALQVTGVVNSATGEALGLTSASAPTDSPVATLALGAFPVQGMCGFSDTWHAARSGGRLHLGVDIIAAEGKLLYAVADGTITKIYTDSPGSLAGNGIRLTMDDGTYFFYAHLSAFADGIEVGTQVVAGQVVGYVGNTGNSGTPHLHFEIHPGGGAAINPYPIVKAIDGCAVTDPVAVTSSN